MKDFQMGWPPALDYLPLDDDRPRAISTPRVRMPARELVRRQVMDLDPYIMNLYPPPAEVKASTPQVYDPKTKTMRPVRRTDNDDDEESCKKPVVKRVAKKLDKLLVYARRLDELRTLGVKASKINKELTVAAIRTFGVDRLTEVNLTDYPMLAEMFRRIAEGENPIEDEGDDDEGEDWEGEDTK